MESCLACFHTVLELGWVGWEGVSKRQMEALLFQPVCLILVDHIGKRYLDCAVKPCGAGTVYRGS